MKFGVSPVCLSDVAETIMFRIDKALGEACYIFSFRDPDWGAVLLQSQSIILIHM